MAKVTAKARSREDRAGDPLDGLVNLFDIGIILSVAFLLAALSSLNLTTEALTENDATSQANTVPADSVITNPDQQAEQITIQPGQEVVGTGTTDRPALPARRRPDDPRQASRRRHRSLRSHRRHRLNRHSLGHPEVSFAGRGVRRGVPALHRRFAPHPEIQARYPAPDPAGARPATGSP